MNPDVQVYCAESSILGEGPVWSAAEQALYWLDIGRKRVLCRGASEAHWNAWPLSDYPGCLAELGQNSIAVAMAAGVHRLNLKSGMTDLLCAVPDVVPPLRFNDGKVDPEGRFWVSTMRNNFGPDGASLGLEQKVGALYRVEFDGTVHTIEQHLGIPNSLAWSPDEESYYFGDSLEGRIYVYDYDADSGDIHHKRLFFELSGCGIPDGSAIDVDGCLWNARWDGGCLIRITPEGKLDRTIKLPVSRPTSCAFGGPDLKTLYVTSATVGLSAEQIEAEPLSGCVFAIEGLAQGLPVPAMVRRT